MELSLTRFFTPFNYKYQVDCFLFVIELYLCNFYFRHIGFTPVIQGQHQVLFDCRGFFAPKNFLEIPQLCSLFEL